jgi:hypothetical protein
VESKECKLHSFRNLDPDVSKAKKKLGDKVAEFNLLIEKRENLFSEIIRK